MSSLTLQDGGADSATTVNSDNTKSTAVGLDANVVKRRLRSRGLPITVSVFLFQMGYFGWKEYFPGNFLEVSLVGNLLISMDDDLFSALWRDRF